MSKDQKKQKALDGLRTAIRGWAFAPEDHMSRYVRLGSEELAKLPPEYREAGEELMQPVRERLWEVNKTHT